MRRLLFAGIPAFALLAAGGAFAADAGMSGIHSGTASEGMGAMHMPSSAQVREAQEKLQSAGAYKGKIDGLAGPQTAAAVKEFQQKNGLKQTGMLDDQTMAKLGVSETGSGSSMPKGSGGAESHTGTGTGTAPSPDRSGGKM